jgi:hypothetical protein
MLGGYIDCYTPAMDVVAACIKPITTFSMAICVGPAGVSISRMMNSQKRQTDNGGGEVMPQFQVTVMREMDAQPMVPDASLVVTAVDEVAAAAMGLRFCGGGYADAIDVSPPDAVSVESETLYSFLKGTSFLYCTLCAGEFAYDVRL